MERYWLEVPLNELFKITMGTKLDFSKMTFQDPQVSFVGRSGLFNGNNKQKVDYIEGIEPYPAGNITVALGGSIGSTFLQDEPFYTSQNVAVLSPLKKHSMNKYHKLYIITLLKHQFSLKFVAFGRELNRYIRNEINLLIPHKNKAIDWDYIEGQIKKSMTSQREELKKFVYNNPKNIINIKEQIWQKYKIIDLFDVKTVKYYQAKSLYHPGDIPFITQTAMNNGVETYVDQEMFELEKGNCVIIGSIGITAFYQEKDFLSDLKIYKIYADSKKGSLMNKEIGLFLATVINMEQFKYGYGRQYYSDNLRQTEIMLPSVYDSIKEKYIPNWEYMQNYIESTTNKVIESFLVDKRNQ